jgi:FHA domain-containing protein
MPQRLHTKASLAALVVWALVCAHPATAQRGAPAPPPAPAAPAQPPPPPAPTEEELRRIQFEEALKDLQRRELETDDLQQKEQLLSQIIEYCIELGRDYANYKQQLADVRAKLAADAQKGNERALKQRRNRAYKDRALKALTESPPRLRDALKDLESALGQVPGDPETLGLKAQVSAELRNILLRRVALGSLVSLASVAALVPLVKRLRKGTRTRELEMLEGPQPGEVFRLEKDTTSLGALAAEADIVITDPFRKISRRHCEISRSGKYYFLADCSTNGTSINGKPVPKGEPVLLRRGDRISLTDDVVLRFR